MSRPSRTDRAATAATRLLDALEVPYTVHRYRYEEHGGTRVASRELGVDEHTVIKTLVMEDEDRRPLVVLMHGDREVATGRLAREIGCKRIAPCVPEVATRHSGYLVGGTSPIGLRKPLPVFIERTILDLPRVFVNGGSRGLLLGIAPGDLDRVLKPTPVDAAAGVSGL
jgi:Cys-tRNA(Pro) deacylase